MRFFVLIVIVLFEINCILKADIVTKYSFEDNLLDTAFNSTVSDDLTVISGFSPIYEMGVVGRAIRFGQDSVRTLRAPASADSDLNGGSFTIEAFIKPETVSSDWTYIVYHWGGGTGSYVLGSYLKTIAAKTYPTYQTIYGGAIIAPDIWQHIAVTGDVVKQELTLWLNGDPVSTMCPWSGPVGPTTEPFYVGYLSSYSGLIDEIILHTEAKDANYMQSRVATINAEYSKNPEPHDKAINLEQNHILQWTAGENASVNDIYLGTDHYTVINAVKNSSEFMGSSVNTSYDPGILELGQTYYWRVDSVNGSEVSKGDVWKFTVTPTDPELAYDPAPNNYGEGCGVSTTILSWSAGTGASSHDVYLGVDANAVANANRAYGEFKTNQAGTTYDPGTLIPDMTYYWRIDEVSGATIKKGPVWCFTTSAYGLDFGLVAPDHLYVVNAGALSKFELILVQTLQGIVAQSKSEIWIAENDPTFLDYIVDNYGVTTTRVEKIKDGDSTTQWLLNHFSDHYDGYLLYDSEDPNSFTVATSLAGVLKGVAVEVSLEPQIQAMGLLRLLDCRGKDDLWVYNNYWNSMNHNAITILKNDTASHWRVRDWSAATQTMMSWCNDPSVASNILSSIIDNSPCFGWNDPASDIEAEFIDLHSANNLYQFSSDYLYNMSVHASFANLKPEIKFEQKSDKTFNSQDGVHYVAFMFMDGDGLQGHIGDWGQNNNYGLWRSSDRGIVPISWGVSPALMKVAPACIDRYYKSATTKDCFYVPYDGMGFFMPRLMPELDQQCQQLNRYMNRSDQSVVLISDASDFDSSYAPVIRKYSSMDSLNGAVLDYPTGQHNKHEINWYGGKPFSTIRFTLWSAAGVSPEQIVSALNNLPKDPTSPSSYSIVTASTWDYTVSDIVNYASQLDPNVKVVTIEELMEQLYMNQVYTVLSDDLANSDIDMAGTRNGTYGDTHSNNSFPEVLTEVLSGDISYLQHVWTFDVTGGNDVTVTFNAQAYHTANSENDDFVFLYSTDYVNWTSMFTVTKTTDDGQVQSFTLPSDISGTVYIGVNDSDLTSGNSGLDSLYVDYMYIRTEVNDTWSSTDIGYTGKSGSFVNRDSFIAIEGSGSDIYGTGDSFRYVYKSLNGDGTITARVPYIENTFGWAKSGLMIRETLDGNSKNAFMGITPSNGTIFQWRPATGGSTSYASTSGNEAPYWIRLTRSGDSFSAYYSSNGTDWTQQGSSQTISMDSDVYIGFAVTSHVPGQNCLTTFDNIEVYRENNCDSSIDGDFDNDCVVDIIDLVLLVNIWLDTSCGETDYCQGVDINSDGIVNLQDYAILAENYR